MLYDAGFEETGQVGEAYDPARHEAIDGRAVGGRARVTEIYTRGLSCLGEVVFRARVQVLPEALPQDQDWSAAATFGEE